MSSLNSGLWRAPQNTKIPAITHVLSFHMTFTANTTTTVALPATASNPAQYLPNQVTNNNFAPQSSPTQPNAEPQQGLRLFVTELCVRDANAALTGAGASAPATVELIDQTQANAIIATVTTAAGVNSPYYVQPVTTGLVVVNPYDQLAVTFTAQTGGTASTATSLIVDVLGYWQQGV